MVTRWLFGALTIAIWVFGGSAHAQVVAPPISYVQASNAACKVGRPNVKAGETVTWQGQCADGLAQGVGIAQWSEAGKPTLRFEGTFARGLLEGNGKMMGADGDRYDGEYKGGLRHGHGIYISANGARFEGEYVNNQRGAASTSSATTATPPGAPSQTAQASTQPVAKQSAPQSTPQPVPSQSGDFKMIQCYVVGVVTKEPLGLPPNEVGPNGYPPGGLFAQNQSALDAISKSNALRLANNAHAFAQQHKGNCPPANAIISLYLLVFNDRIPDKMPTLSNLEKAYLVPGLVMYAEEVSDGPRWKYYNIAYQRAVVEQAQKEKDAANAALRDFEKRNKLSDGASPTKLKANPFSYEKQNIATVLQFVEMRSPSTALFDAPNGNREYLMLVTDVPKTLFSERQSAVLGVKVLGTTTVEEGAGKRTVPHLQFLDAIKCKYDNCSDILK